MLHLGQFGTDVSFELRPKQRSQLCVLHLGHLKQLIFWLLLSCPRRPQHLVWFHDICSVSKIEVLGSVTLGFACLLLWRELKF